MLLTNSTKKNPESDIPFNYYSKNMCLSFLVHLINVIGVRFAKCEKTVMITQALIPSVTAERDVTIDDIVKIYKDESPAPNNCQEEFIQWKRRWSVRDISERMQTIWQGLTNAYPNLSVLLKIAGTAAVKSCERKRSGSVLKSLNTYLRASMRQEGLSGTVLMHINYDVEISVDRLMSIFVKKPRALEYYIRSN